MSSWILPATSTKQNKSFKSTHCRMFFIFIRLSRHNISFRSLLDVCTFHAKTLSLEVTSNTSVTSFTNKKCLWWWISDKTKSKIKTIELNFCKSSTKARRKLSRVKLKGKPLFLKIIVHVNIQKRSLHQKFSALASRSLSYYLHPCTYRPAIKHKNVGES